MIYHTRAGFKCLRETIGYSQRDIASMESVMLNSVKRWERPGENYEGYYDTPLEVWRDCERVRARQVAWEDAVISAVEDALARADGPAMEILNVAVGDGNVSMVLARRKTPAGRAKPGSPSAARSGADEEGRAKPGSPSAARSGADEEGRAKPGSPSAARSGADKEGRCEVAVEVACCESAATYEDGIQAGQIPDLGSWLAVNESAGRIADELDGMPGASPYVVYVGRNDARDRMGVLARWAANDTHGISHTPARLRLLRELLGRTQNEMAAAFDTDVAHIRFWEGWTLPNSQTAQQSRTTIGNLPYRDDISRLDPGRAKGAGIWARLIQEREQQLELEQMVEDSLLAGLAYLAEKYPTSDNQVATIPLFRSQKLFEECRDSLSTYYGLSDWRESLSPSWWWLSDIDSYLVANAVSRHVADVLDGEGCTVLVYYGGLQDAGRDLPGSPSAARSGADEEGDSQAFPYGIFEKPGSEIDFDMTELPGDDGLPEYVGCHEVQEDCWHWLVPAPPQAWLDQHDVPGWDPTWPGFFDGDEWVPYSEIFDDGGVERIPHPVFEDGND